MELQCFNSKDLLSFLFDILFFMILMYLNLSSRRQQLGQLSERHRRSRLRSPRGVPRMRRHLNSGQGHRCTTNPRHHHPHLPNHQHHRTARFHTRTGGHTQSNYCPPHQYHHFFTSTFDFIPVLLSFLPGW